MPQQDACALLDSDHQQVEKMFADYQSASDETEKSRLAQAICQALTVHATIEEEIFYPAFRSAAGDDGMVDEVEHHVREEREEMFTKARQLPGLDLMALGAELESRKRELMSGSSAA
jgi:hemerythrin superfamily protein